MLAHQFLGQLPDLLRQAVIGNAGTIVCFRIGAEDAPLLTDELGIDNEEAATGLANYSAWLKSIDSNTPTEPHICLLIPRSTPIETTSSAFKTDRAPPTHGSASTSKTRSRASCALTIPRQRAKLPPYHLGGEIMSSPWKKIGDKLGETLGDPVRPPTPGKPDTPNNPDTPKTPNELHRALNKHTNFFDGSVIILLVIFAPACYFAYIAVNEYLYPGGIENPATLAILSLVFVVATYVYWRIKTERIYPAVPIDEPDLPTPDLTPPTSGNMRVVIQRRQSTYATRNRDILKDYPEAQGGRYVQHEMHCWVVLSEAAKEYVKTSAELPRALIYERPIHPDRIAFWEARAKANPDAYKNIPLEKTIQYSLADVLKKQPFIVTTKGADELTRAETQIKTNLETVGHLLSIDRNRPPTQSDSFEF